MSLKGSFAIISHVLFYALTNRFVAGRKNCRLVLNFKTLLQFYDGRRNLDKNSYTFANRQHKIMFIDDDVPRKIFTRKAIFIYIKSLNCENVSILSFLTVKMYAKKLQSNVKQIIFCFILFYLLHSFKIEYLSCLLYN